MAYALHRIILYFEPQVQQAITRGLVAAKRVLAISHHGKLETCRQTLKRSAYGKTRSNRTAVKLALMPI
jgi:hypothetical protein